MFDKEWTIKEFINEEDREKVKLLAEEAELPVFMAETLVKRGIYTAQTADEYFTPSIQDFHDPYLFEDMEAAVQRMIDAGEEKERVTVFGDYDCDGICAASILYHFLTEKLELNADWFIPNRFADGYGLSKNSISLIAQRGTTLIITVDCGIVSCEEVAFAKELGIDIIITDHHRCAEQIPEAVAVIDPVKPGCQYPFQYLCGAGVAYKVIEALAEAIGLEGRPVEYLPLAAIATIGDSVSLSGENRNIVAAGIQHMSDSCWTGLNRLMNSAGIRPPLSVRNIAFGLVPRINAAGRMGSGERALRLLLAQEEETAFQLAEELSEENKSRQMLESRIASEAILPSSIKTDAEDAVVISVGTGWHHGVVGIVASRLTEKFNKPSIVFAYEEDGVTIRGSARSVPGFNIHKALTGCRECLEKFGGHEMAAGMSLKADKLPELIAGLNRYAQEVGIPKYAIPRVYADNEMPLSEITLENAALLERVQPCGEGNPEPVYIARGLHVVKCSAVGSSGAHLRIQFSIEDGTTGQYGRPVSGIAFHCGRLVPMVSSLNKCDILFKLNINEWNGNRSVSLQILDIREADVYNTACGRKELVMLYNAVNRMYKDGFSREDLPNILMCLKQNDREYTWFKLFKAIEIFKELGILQKEKDRYMPVRVREKLELEKSEVYKACCGRG